MYFTLQSATDMKNKYLKYFRMFGREEDKESYKKAKNELTHKKRKSKRKYYKDKIKQYEGESSKTWNILKEVTNYNYREEILPDNVTKQTADEFNTFFATVGIKAQKKLNINIPAPDHKNGEFVFAEETSQRVEYLINRIKPNVATGYDELSARLIKEATPVIKEDLRDLINLSYKVNTFPDALKRANVKAIHKKGGNNDPAQYRPVSILTVISKVFERSAVEQMMDFYTANNKLNSKQHAYRKNPSTTTCLFEMVETVRDHLDKKRLVGIAALDLSKAFDSLAHNLILGKLTEMGLDHTAISWINSYLEERTQVVKFGNISSNQETVESGVPQGSILGPLLFITCTNDITIAMKDEQIFTYADDMQIVVTGHTTEEVRIKLEKAIDTANQYYNKNSLLCNPGKTEVMLLASSRNKLDRIEKLRVSFILI